MAILVLRSTSHGLSSPTSTTKACMVFEFVVLPLTVVTLLVLDTWALLLSFVRKPFLTFVWIWLASLSKLPSCVCWLSQLLCMFWPRVYSILPLENPINYGDIQFVFCVLQLLQNQSTQQNLYCISNSAMQQVENPSLLLFSYDYHKYMFYYSSLNTFFIEYRCPPNCVYYWKVNKIWRRDPISF